MGLLRHLIFYRRRADPDTSPAGLEDGMIWFGEPMIWFGENMRWSLSTDA